MDTEQIFQMIVDFDNQKLATVLDDTLDYTVQDKRGDTFLHCAARVDNVEAFELLLTEGEARLDEPDRSGASVLMTACAWGALSVVDLILRKYAFAFDINEGMQAGDTMPYTYLRRSQQGSEAQRLELLMRMIALGAKSESPIMPREIREWLQEGSAYYQLIAAAKQAYYEIAQEFVERVQPVDALHRFALRRAYSLLAETEYQRGNLSAAMEYLNLLFSTADEADDKLLFTVEDEALRVQVYKLFANRDEAWLPYYKEVLQSIVDNNTPMIDAGVYQDIIDYDIEGSGKYTLARNKPLVRVKGERFIEAFDRFCVFRKATKDDEADYEVNEPATEEELTEAAMQIGFELPAALQHFYRQTGNGLGDSQSAWCQGLSMYAARGTHEGFFEDIEENWFDGEVSFLEDDYVEPEDAEFVNNNYKVFASFLVNEDEHYYFFFGKNGRFGLSQFCQDGMEFDEEILNRDMPLLKYDDLDELFSKFLQIQINRKLCEQNMIHDDYWCNACDLSKVR